MEGVVIDVTRNNELFLAIDSGEGLDNVDDMALQKIWRRSMLG